MMESHKQIIETLMDKIFEAEVKQYHTEMSQLIDENEEFLGETSFGFNHLGVNYGRGGQIVRNCPSLNPALVARVNTRLRIQRDVEFGQRMVHQALLKLFQSCKNLQDIRDTLPDCLVNLHPELPLYPRTREPAWSLQGNARELHHYQKALTRIETYLAMRLLY